MQMIVVSTFVLPVISANPRPRAKQIHAYRQTNPRPRAKQIHAYRQIKSTSTCQTYYFWLFCRLTFFLFKQKRIQLNYIAIYVEKEGDMSMLSNPVSDEQNYEELN